jgi:uncharacterized protein YbjT (DUF2867 family)
MDDATDRGNPRAPELEDLLSLCASLQREKVRYVLIGGFAVVLHGWVRATKDIDLLVESSVANVQALKRAMSVLPDNAVALIEDDELAKYPVIRVADEIVVDLMKEACGIDYQAALGVGIESKVLEGVEIRLAGMELLIRTKQTIRESDAMDVRFLRMRLEEDLSAKRQVRPAGEVADSPPSRSALIVGATGLVGGFLLDGLLKSSLYREVRVVARRSVDRAHVKLTEVVADFDQLEDVAMRFGVDDVFCCLGSTIKKAGSEAAFRKVDHDYVSTMARLTRAAGARRFLLVSSIGADSASANLYLKVKGDAERSVEACGFPALHVFRPSLLTGPRQEHRRAERAATVAMRFVVPLLTGGLRRYRPVHARTLASAMLAAAELGADGYHVYRFDDIVRWANEAPGEISDAASAR